MSKDRLFESFSLALLDSDVEGYGANPAEAYIDLAGKLPGGRP